MATNQERLDLYLTAEARILKGQSYRVAGRDLQMPDLEQVRAEIALLREAVRRETAAAAGTGGRFSQANFS